MNTRLFLFDISAYLHRAMYVTYGDRVSEIGPGDDAFIRHACNMLANSMETLAVRHMAVVCDSIEPSLRVDEFPAYKVDRKPHPAVFAAQVPRFLDALRDISVAVVAEPRYEADDLIATLCAFGGDVMIVSSDKDLLALVTDDGPSVQFYDPMKGSWCRTSDVREKFGVYPSQLYDYLGLVGDTADGIPGVDGIGAKTAAKLLREFDSLDEIYSPERRDALAEFASKKQLASLLANKDAAFLSRRLAVPRIYPQMPAMSLEHFAAQAPSVVRKACG